MHKKFLKIGAVSGAIAVALGAFGAHKLKQILAPDAFSAFSTGVQYQIYHTLALLIVAIIYQRQPNKFLVAAGYFFSGGIVLFSGSLYLISLLKAFEKEAPVLIGVLTPVGGLSLIAGWLFFFTGIFRRDSA